jgi:hypothetical protein
MKFLDHGSFSSFEGSLRRMQFDARKRALFTVIGPRPSKLARARDQPVGIEWLP